MAGTVTLTKTGIGSIQKWSLGWTSDGSGDATVNFIANGKLRRAVFNPGTPAPTDNYDVVINDDEGFDILTGQGANRDTATSEVAASGSLLPYLVGQHSLAVSNAGSAKAGEIILYLEP